MGNPVRTALNTDKNDKIPPRQRILTAAGDLFYRHGIRAVELPEKDHPARPVIEDFKRGQRPELVRLCGNAGLTEPEMLADELHLLLEGARVTAQSGGADGLGPRLMRMSEALIASHRLG